MKYIKVKEKRTEKYFQVDFLVWHLKDYIRSISSVDEKHSVKITNIKSLIKEVELYIEQLNKNGRSANSNDFDKYEIYWDTISIKPIIKVKKDIYYKEQNNENK